MKKLASEKSQFGNISVDSNIDDLTEVLQSVFPALVSEVKDEYDGILKVAKDRWPVKSGKSKELLFVDIEADSDSATVSLNGDANYTKYIKTFKNGLNNKSPAQELIFNPHRKLTKKILADLKKELEKINGK